MSDWLTSRDPEPEPGTIVETESGMRWERLYDYEQGEVSWIPEASLPDDDLESWVKVAGNYGPVRIVSRP